jgi:hypothetical protein
VVDKKVNNWCYKYFIAKKKGLIDIFMRKINTKKSLNNEIVYVMINYPDKILQKLLEAALVMTDK